jgi:hypothetical protein
LQGNNISGKTFSVQNPTRFISVSDPHWLYADPHPAF